MSGMSAAIGCVEGSWSCLYAHAFQGQHRLAAGLAREVGHPRPEDVVLQEGDRARVLHRAFLELGHEELVVLAERVLDPERLVVEVEALPGHLEDLVRVQVPGERLVAETPRR